MNNEEVMQTAYTSGQCSRMWRDVQSLGKDFLDKEVHRALRYKFNRTVPRPLKTVYKYWEGALWVSGISVYGVPLWFIVDLLHILNFIRSAILLSRHWVSSRFKNWWIQVRSFHNSSSRRHFNVNFINTLLYLFSILIYHLLSLRVPWQELLAKNTDCTQLPLSGAAFTQFTKRLSVWFCDFTGKKRHFCPTPHGCCVPKHHVDQK